MTRQISGYPACTMAKTSAGLLMFRERSGRLEVLLVHPGGPFWKNKDEGAWSIPKGEVADTEDPLSAARREFEEETGFPAEGEAIALSPLKQAGGKVVHAWAVRGDLDPERIRSNSFSLEWPPKSGRTQDFPEVDRAGWFPLDLARRKLLQGQVDFLDQLQARSIG
jgi:predicted NUDIX family NTP pyrophosphohydrolase